MAGAWTAVVISELFVIVSAVTLLWPGAINAVPGQSYSIEDSWGVSRAFFEWVTLGSFAVMVLAGVPCWAIPREGSPTGRGGLGFSGAPGTPIPLLTC